MATTCFNMASRGARLLLALFVVLSSKGTRVQASQCPVASDEYRESLVADLKESLEGEGFDVRRGAMWIFRHDDIDEDCRDCSNANPTSSYPSLSYPSLPNSTASCIAGRNVPELATPTLPDPAVFPRMQRETVNCILLRGMRVALCCVRVAHAPLNVRILRTCCRAYRVITCRMVSCIAPLSFVRPCITQSV